MLSLLIALAPAMIQDPAVPDGARLAESQTCYTLTMSRDGVTRPIGVTWQTIERTERDGRAVLEIVVHQSINGGAFDMRDDFVLDAASLRPLSLRSRRNGHDHVAVTYAADRITGQRVDADGAAQAIDVPLEEAVWEGNLWGLTFAALPLAEGATFSLPYWQYDKGFGRFVVRVTGSETVETAAGPVAAWVVEAAPGDGPPIRYLIGKADHKEIGYSTAQGSQTQGGDCSGLGQTQ